jgi:hypothetical protein
MRWLLTVASDADVASLERAVRAAHGSLTTEEPIPLGADEVCLVAEGPADFASRLHEQHAGTHAIHPQSEPTAY